MDAILGIIDAAGGRLRSRIALQKISYFASTLGLIDVEFRPHYYGPYSQEISTNAMNLQSYNLLTEESVILGTQQDPWLFSISGNVKAYQYALTEESQEMLSEIKEINRNEMKYLEELVSICKKWKMSPAILSTAAKIDFILKRSGSAVSNIEDMKAIAKNFGWKLEDSQITAAIELINEVRSLKRSMAQ